MKENETVETLITITTPSGSYTWIAQTVEEIEHFKKPGQGHTIKTYVLVKVE